MERLLENKVLRKYDANETSMFIHARIKTHGTCKIQNCHGWKEHGLIFAHNGVLSITNRDDLTDSETYFRDIFAPAYKVGGWKMAEKTIDAIRGSLKFVFMDDNGNIRHYGNYIEDDGGLLYSNDSYAPRKTFVRRGISFYDDKWLEDYYRRHNAKEADDLFF